MAPPSLPAEIWRQIFQHFCIHCQQSRHSDNLPNFTLPDAQEGKAALKSLSLVSRDCRSMSQDILFHYFFTLSQGGACTPRTRDLTPRMLRTLISNPHLAKQVRMMALFNQCNTLTLYHGITRRDLQSWVEVSRSHNVSVMEEITTALEHEGGDTNAALRFDHPGPAAQLQRPSQALDDETEVYNYEFRHKFCEWMYCLLLKLAPNITHVQVQEPLKVFGDPSKGEMPACALSFPSVRVLTYNDTFVDKKLVVRSLTQFPNLSTFGCYHFGFTYNQPLDPMHSGHPQTNIRKLSIACWPDALLDLLQCCPRLQDLEVHISLPSKCEKSRKQYFDWPAHTKATLRRLVWSDDENSQFLDANTNSRAVLPPIMDLQRLEILEIDQASLLLHSRSKTGGISRYVFPASLRILHIAFAQDISSVAEISESLKEVAAARETLFPKPAIVKVDHPPSPTEGTANLAEAMHAGGVVSCMATAGIELRFELEWPLELRKAFNGTSRRFYHERRRMAPLFVGTVTTHDHIVRDPHDHQCELFSLEDLVSL